MTPASTSRSATSWAAAAGVAMMPIAMPRSRDDRRAGRRWARPRGRRRCSPTLAGSASTSATTAEAAGAEAAVVGERLAEVADADDHDRPVVGEAELAADLVQQVLDVVADAPGAVGAEVGEVLADLGRVDAGQLGQPLRRDRRRLRPRPARAGAQVDGQAGDRRLGDAPRRRGCGSTMSARSTLRQPVHEVAPSDRCLAHTCTEVGPVATRDAAVTGHAAAPAAARPCVAAGLRAASHLRARGWPGASRHELAWTIALAMFAARRRPRSGPGPRSAGTADVPALLPARRHPQRPVARARHRLPAGRPAAGRPSRGGRRPGRRPSRPACWPWRRSDGADRRPTGFPQGKDVFGALPRVLAAVGSGRRRRDHRRRAVVGVGRDARWRAGQRAAGRGQRAHRARHARARRAAGCSTRSLGEMEAFAITLASGSR